MGMPKNPSASVCLSALDLSGVLQRISALPIPAALCSVFVAASYLRDVPTGSLGRTVTRD
jgi:hypothetical protein